MAWSLRISWENGQPRASFSHFMWRKPKTRQTNICSFFHNKHLREKTTNLREKTTALSLLRLYQLLFTCLLWKTTRHPLLVQFYTEQTKVQGSWSTCSSHARLFTKTLKGCANLFIQVSDFLTGSLTRYIKRAFPRFFWPPLATLMDQNTSRSVKNWGHVGSDVLESGLAGP